MNVYVDIDNTICVTKNEDYENAIPIWAHIKKINRLYTEGHTIIYYTARGSVTKKKWYKLTTEQLIKWECKYHELSVGEKPPYDLLICDKTKRIDEI